MNLRLIKNQVKYEYKELTKCASNRETMPIEWWFFLGHTEIFLNIDKNIYDL